MAEKTGIGVAGVTGIFSVIVALITVGKFAPSIGASGFCKNRTRTMNRESSIV
jgi:hypothetical protein